MKLVNCTIGISLLLCGCSGLNQSSENREVFTSSSKKIERIVTLTSLSTDIVNSLSTNKLVGIPGSSIFKDNKDYQDLPRISQGRTPPNLEKIVSLKPDLVIGTVGFHDKILSKIEDLNIQTLSYELKDWDTLEKTINFISTKLEINDSPKLRKVFSTNLKECFINNDSNKKPNVVVLASTKPILSPNSRSWAGNLLERFGLNSLTKDLDSKSEFKGYVNLSPEWLIKEDPENLIIIQTRPGQYVNFEKSRPFSNLKAVKSNKVYRFNYYGLINAGSLESINNACLKLREI
tara:strand:+ start:1571 stop:2443 length:873 start_codon:yes stop_codon:yes gene_type:complete